MSRRLLLPVLAAVAALLLAGCGSSSDSDDAGHNDADVTFAQTMIPHHQQAVEMAEMALDPARQASAPVRDLATRIGDAQQPEIETMQGWLDAWGAEAEDHSGHDMGSMKGMSGMMSDEQMSALGQATGTAFDRMWLQMMVEHHEGAVEMAETEIADGESAEAKDLARDIVEAQESEITEMQRLLS
jgi:uncharacterized protein (DUF305 family)